MAVVKTNFVKRGKDEKKRAKATVRYIQHRPGKDGKKQIRTLFGRDGVTERIDAYRMIDEAQKSDILFRAIVTPDPNEEDTKQDLNMREVARSDNHEN
jgi:predicted SnoaL-like aldol condensation-catalyzing enzyme